LRTWCLEFRSRGGTVARHSAVPEPRGERRRREEEKEALRSVRGRAEATPVSLDRLIHERMRLGIVSALAANESLTFNELKALLQTTDGNLSVHARKLEEAGYISCTKSFEGRMPKTEYALTAPGRKAFERYLDHMEALIRAARDA
jgi:DNA-binding HxlR family transcriptional regulator